MDSYIFLVGRSDSHNESIKAIRGLGLKVGIFQDVARPVKQPELFDAIIPISFTSFDASSAARAAKDFTIIGLQCTYESYIVAKAKLGVLLHLPTLSLDAAEKTTDKLLMRQAFAEHAQEYTPRFTHASTTEEARHFASEVGFPVIIKPTNLVKSLLVMRCENESELIKNFQYAVENIERLYHENNVHDRTPQLIVEEFITGKSCSIAAFVDETGTPHFCEGIVGLTTARERNISDSYLYERVLPLEVNELLREKLFAAAEAGVRALDMRSTPAHIELIYDANSVQIIEIGARIGGYRPRMYAFSYGVDLIEQEIRLALGKKPTLGKATFTKYCAVYELFPEAEGLFNTISGNFDPDLFAYYRVTAREGSLIGRAKSGYKATAIVIVTHAEKQQFDKLRHTVSSLQVEVRS